MPAMKRTVVRRLALALAAVQLAAVAFVPIAEALLERQTGPVSIEAVHEHCAVVHQPGTCPACALAIARARPAERVQLVFAGDESVLAEVPARAGGPSRATPDTARTRAPPPHAV